MMLEKNYHLDDKSIHIMVDYHPDRGIDDILDFSVTDYKKGTNVKLLEILHWFFPDEFDNMIDKINWYEIYREKIFENQNSEL